MKLGGHCVLFGPAIKDDTDGVLGKLAFAGAEGCELGERFFSLEEREKLEEALSRHHLELAGLHCNNLSLMDLLYDGAKSRQALRRTAAFASLTPNRNVIATGSTGDNREELRLRRICDGSAQTELHDPEQVAVLAVRLNDLVREIRDEFGVTVHYHNHSWEFADNGLIFRTLAEKAPDLHFALDTGWAAISGFDPVELLEEYPGRFAYVHLRDYAAREGLTEQSFGEAHTGFIALGTGSMGYPRLMRTLQKTLPPDGWAVVEYELGNFDENSYLRAISYLKGIRDML